MVRPIQASASSTIAVSSTPNSCTALITIRKPHPLCLWRVGGHGPFHSASVRASQPHFEHVTARPPAIAISGPSQTCSHLEPHRVTVIGGVDFCP